jgi:hypothetical protein
VLGVGVGSGVYELEPSRERDELPPVIFLNALETYRPMPFMMQRKQVQLKTGYVSEIEFNVLTRELLLLSCSKEKREKEREVSWIQILSKNPMKTREQSLRKFETE